MLEKSNDIYTINNPYGYRFNINHPMIKPYYERYIRWKGIYGAPSDKERFEFEDYMEKHIKKGNKKF